MPSAPSAYDTMPKFLHAYTSAFERLDGPEDWKGYLFVYDADEGEIIEVNPHAGRAGRWLVSLNTTLGESEVEGRGELAPDHLPHVIERLRAREAQLARVDHERELAQLKQLAEEAARAQAELRYRARMAVTGKRIKKVAVAEAVGISRPTLDAWLSGS